MATTETKVGLLVTAGLGALGWLSVNSGLLGTAGQTNMRTLTSQFDDVEGLSVGSDVRMAGVTVGQVKDIALTQAGGAAVKFTVRDSVPLSNQAAAQITANGLIGEKFLELKPGGGAQPLPLETTTILSSGTVAVDNIAGNFAQVADDLGAITSSLRTALGGPENAQKLAGIINSFDGFSARLDTLLNNEVKDGQISNIITNLENATNTLNNIFAGNEGESKELIANFGTTAKNLADITERLSNGEGFLGKLLTENDAEGAGLDGALFANLDEAALGIRQITDKINSGQGTIGKLINDEDLANQLTDTLATFSDTANRLENFRTTVDIGANSLVAEGVAKGRFEVTVAPRENRYYLFGITADGLANEADSTEGVNRFAGLELGEETKFTAQFGFVAPQTVFNQKVGLRLGLRDSTAGVGIDTTAPNPIKVGWLSENIGLKADLYDFSGENSGNSDVPHLDLAAKLGFSFLGQSATYAQVGYDNVFDDELGSPFVGLGLRFDDEDLKFLVGSAL